MQEMWNTKFDREEFLYGEEPNAFIKEHTHLLKKNSRILCLGEGEGRNALYLAKFGFNVEALDASDIGLMKLQKKALEGGVAITIRHTLFENWQPHGRYNAILCSFMHLPKEAQDTMFTKSFLALEEGGYFIGEFFSTSQLKFQSGGPKDKNLLYDICDIHALLKNLPCEILKLSLEIVELNEGIGHKGKASVIRILFQKLS